MSGLSGDFIWKDGAILCLLAGIGKLGRQSLIVLSEMNYGVRLLDFLAVDLITTIERV